MGKKPHRKNNSKNKGGKQTDAAGLARRILQFLDAHYGEEFNSKQIIKKLEIRDALTKGGVEPVLSKLVEAGSVSRNPRNYY
ncbi:MAG: ribonuclease R, partial [Algoriphagus sp.]